MSGNFTLREFDSKDDLFAYIQHRDYGLDSHPAVCYGFSLHEGSRREFELELFFNGLWPSWYRGVPDQRDRKVDQTNGNLLSSDWKLYTQHGFLWL